MLLIIKNHKFILDLLCIPHEITIHTLKISDEEYNRNIWKRIGQPDLGQELCSNFQKHK